jgi:hypothetical protein
LSRAESKLQWAALKRIYIGVEGVKHGCGGSVLKMCWKHWLGKPEAVDLFESWRTTWEH